MADTVTSQPDPTRTVQPPPSSPPVTPPATAAASTATDDAQRQQDQQAAIAAGTFAPQVVPTVPLATASLTLDQDRSTANVGALSADQTAALQTAFTQVFQAFAAAMVAVIQQSVAQAVSNASGAAQQPGATTTQQPGATTTQQPGGIPLWAQPTSPRSGTGTGGTPGWAQPTTAPGNSGAANTADSGSGDGSLAANQRQLVAQAQAAGATPRQQQVIMAIAMQETNHISNNERDRSKDGNAASKNISALNVNADLLRHIEPGCNPSTMTQAQVVGALVKGMNDPHIGESGLLNYMRGGSTAFKDGHSYGAQEYANAIRNVASRLASQPSLLTAGKRIAHNIGAV